MAEEKSLEAIKEGFRSDYQKVRKSSEEYSDSTYDYSTRFLANSLKAWTLYYSQKIKNAQNRINLIIKILSLAVTAISGIAIFKIDILISEELISLLKLGSFAVGVLLLSVILEIFIIMQTEKEFREKIQEIDKKSADILFRVTDLKTHFLKEDIEDLKKDLKKKK